MKFNLVITGALEHLIMSESAGSAQQRFDMSSLGRDRFVTTIVGGCPISHQSPEAR